MTMLGLLRLSCLSSDFVDKEAERCQEWKRLAQGHWGSRRQKVRVLTPDAESHPAKPRA